MSRKGSSVDGQSNWDSSEPMLVLLPFYLFQYFVKTVDHARLSQTARSKPEFGGSC